MSIHLTDDELFGPARSSMRRATTEHHRRQVIIRPDPVGKPSTGDDSRIRLNVTT